jgi:putative transposase
MPVVTENRDRSLAVLEHALAEELTDHVGYEQGDPGGRGSGNSATGAPPGGY